MNVHWTLIFAPMEFVKTYVVATVVIVTVAMNLILLEGTVLVSCFMY